MKVLITGACGFCGRRLAQSLAGDRTLRLVGADRVEAQGALRGLCDYRRTDLGDAAQIETVVREVRPDCILHLAGVSAGAEIELYRINFLGTVNLLEAVRRHVPAARVLLVGSAAEYGAVARSDLPLREAHSPQPAGAYGGSKYAATLAGVDYVRRYGMKVVMVRPFNIVGAGIPASLVIGALLERAKSALAGPEPACVRIGNLDAQRDFVSVTDAVDAYWRALQGDHWGEVFNVCSGRPRSIRSMAKALLRLAPRPVTLRVDPDLVRPSDVPVVYGSYEKARRAFGFEPSVSMECALQEAWNSAMQPVPSGGRGGRLG
jgi:GDP-4-dehydro-6-deoxy-D-mannose reductase